jgi:hypothetical protein
MMIEFPVSSTSTPAAAVLFHAVLEFGDEYGDRATD